MKQVDWIQRFRDFFANRADDLGVVLQASGCREGWLQAEAFRYFRSKGVAMYTNQLTLPDPTGKQNKKADLASYSGDDDDAELELVAEVKVYGERGFYPKIVTGGDLSEVRRRVARASPVTFSDQILDRQLVVGWGLLADYFRLVDYDAGEDTPVRLLILCVQRADEPDNLGRILSQIEFEGPGDTILDTPSIWVKAWRIGGGAKRG